MNRYHWYFHPVFVFVSSILALALSLFLYIYWYMEVSAGLRNVVEKFNIDAGKVLAYETWVVILVLSILVGLILLGIFIIFVYNQKTFQLYRLQQNFINNFTHELKTPVTSLKLYLETFVKHELPRDHQTKYLGYMLLDVERLSENINRILNISKLESKSYGGEYALLDIVSTVERFLLTNKYLFPGCEIEMEAEKDLSLPYRMNGSLFDMMLMNLLKNAVTYNRSETPTVGISFEATPKSFAIRLEDNGIGMEKCELKKIFKKFYQAGSSDDMTAKGSGLGLYFAQQVARIHNGKLVAESQGPGKGSVFTLVLPRTQKVKK